MPVTTSEEIGSAIYISTDAGYIYSWDAQTGQLTEEMRSGLPLTDLALAPDGTLYGITATSLYEFDLATDSTTHIGALVGDVTPFISSLTGATGFSISASGEGRISSDNNSIVAVVDLATGAVSSPYGTSLGQGQSSAGDIIHDDEGYWISTDSYTIKKIVPGTTFPEFAVEDDWIGALYEGLAVAPTGVSNLSAGEILGFYGQAVYQVENNTFGLIPYQTLSVAGNITGATQAFGTTSGTDGSGEPGGPTDMLPVIEGFDDGVLNGGNWSYGPGTRVEEANGSLGIYQDVTDNGGSALYSLTEPTRDFTLTLDEFHHAANSYYFGGTNFTFEAASGEIFSINYANLKSAYGPDYGSDSNNYDHPRLKLTGVSTNETALYDYSHSTTSLLDAWITTEFAVDSTTGSFTVDNLGDGVVDIMLSDQRLVGASLTSIGFDGYGWYTGHYRLIDRFELTGEAPSDTGAGPDFTAKKIFKNEGKMTFMADLAMAAYYLDTPRENASGYTVNDLKGDSIPAYAGIMDWITLLDSGDIPVSGGTVSLFGTSGFENGIFTNENAAALVGRASDAMFLSFRGTNDNSASAGLYLLGDGNFNTPDEEHWIGKDDHFKLYNDLIKGIKTYIKDVNNDSDASNDVQTFYVSGHSLGAAMVEAFMEKFPKKIGGVNIEAINFASPGYGVGLGEDSRVATFYLSGDPIILGATADNIGDINKVLHNIDWGLFPNAELHSMKLYSDFIRFFEKEGLSETDFEDLNGIDYDRIYADVLDYSMGIDANTGNYKIGEGDDKIKASKKDDIIVGGNGKDKLIGKKGDDHILGGKGKDTLEGGEGTDSLLGGKGKDKFVFDSTKDGTDTIADFEGGVDQIKLTGLSIEFDDLTIKNHDSGASAKILYDELKIILEGVSKSDIGMEDFIF